LSGDQAPLLPYQGAGSFILPQRRAFEEKVIPSRGALIPTDPATLTRDHCPLKLLRPAFRVIQCDHGSKYNNSNDAAPENEAM